MAKGHFIFSVQLSLFPTHLVQKFSHFLEGLITFSPHLAFQSFIERLGLSREIPRPGMSEDRPERAPGLLGLLRVGLEGRVEGGGGGEAVLILKAVEASRAPQRPGEGRN